MICAWKEFLSILPPDLRQAVDLRGKDKLQELRMRIGRPPQLVSADGVEYLSRNVNPQDILFVVNTASRYSPWAASGMADGFLTAPGGHRIGLCGQAIIRDGNMTGFRELSSLNLRVARDFPGISGKAKELSGNLLLLGPPGSGKTTLLRDLIRQISAMGQGSISVVDEREEFFPRTVGGFSFDTGPNTDVLQGCNKLRGLEIALRTLGPSVIALDEISAAEDCRGLIAAGWCGVRLLASVHAATAGDLKQRALYRPLVETGLFDWLLVLHKDKSWHLERMVT